MRWISSTGTSNKTAAANDQGVDRSPLAVPREIVELIAEPTGKLQRVRRGVLMRAASPRYRQLRGQPLPKICLTATRPVFVVCRSILLTQQQLFILALE